MADLRFTITKLNNGNYETWKSKVELLLIKEDLWQTVNKDKPADANEKWLKADGQARAIIGLLLEDDQLIHFKGTTTAKEAWEALRKYHQKASLSNQVHLLKRIINLKLSEDGEIEKFIHEMLSVVDRLAAIGEVLKEKLIISIMLSNLPDSYSTLITALETRNEEELTLELVKGKLVDEATRRNHLKREPHEQDKVLKVVQKNKPAAHQHKEQSNTYTCYFCKKIGHLKKDCIKYQKWKERNPAKTIQKVCQVVSNGMGADASSSETCVHVENGDTTWDRNDWCIDSGATSHMSNNKEFFKNLKNCNKENVRLANGSYAEIEGRGDGEILCEDSEGNPLAMPIKDVLFVPALKENLLSVKRLTENEIEVAFTKGKCTIKYKDVTIQADVCGDLFKLRRTERALVTQNQHSPNCQHT